MSIHQRDHASAPGFADRDRRLLPHYQSPKLSDRLQRR
jgi:hypothetical protein